MAEREKLQALRWEDEQLSAIDSRANQIEELNALGISQIIAAQTSHTKAIIKGNIVANIMKDSMRTENEMINQNHYVVFLNMTSRNQIFVLTLITHFDLIMVMFVIFFLIVEMLFYFEIEIKPKQK